MAVLIQWQRDCESGVVRLAVGLDFFVQLLHQLISHPQAEAVAFAFAEEWLEQVLAAAGGAVVVHASMSFMRLDIWAEADLPARRRGMNGIDLIAPDHLAGFRAVFYRRASRFFERCSAGRADFSRCLS